MKDDLDARAARAVLRLALIVGLLVFVPAATGSYWQGWVYLAVFVGASALITWDLARRDRALLERRLRGGAGAETRGRQKRIMVCATLAFVALQVVPGLERRFGAPSVPPIGVVAGDLLIAIGFWVMWRVFRANSFAAATVDVDADQTVVTTGPYAVVRHPMYAGVALYFAGTPLALGSWWAFVPAAALLAILAWRLSDEEAALVARLPGYAEYRQRLRWRLMPGLW